MDRSRFFCKVNRIKAAIFYVVLSVFAASFAGGQKTPQKSPVSVVPAKATSSAPVPLGKPGDEVRAAKEVLNHIAAAKSNLELLPYFGNEDSVFAAAAALFSVLMIADDPKKEYSSLRRDLSVLLKRYNLVIPENIAGYETLLERVRPHGRKFAEDICRFVADRQKVPNKTSQSFGAPYMRADQSNYIVLSPMRVRVTPKSTKYQSITYEVRVEDGCWRVCTDTLKKIKASFSQKSVR